MKDEHSKKVKKVKRKRLPEIFGSVIIGVEKKKRI